MSSVVDEDVDAAEVADRPLDNRPAVLRPDRMSPSTRVTFRPSASTSAATSLAS